MGIAQAWRVGCLTVAVAAGLATPLAAHPHIFIETTVTAILDPQGRLTAIRLRWDYDWFLSMLVAEDRGADVNKDGSLSASEAAVLDGFGMTWVEGFDGDTTLFQDETSLSLVPDPKNWMTGWVADDMGGHLWSEHTRRLVTPADPGEGLIRIVVHDVTGYTAYNLTYTALNPDLQQDGVAACRIGPAEDAADEADGGLLSTVGSFLFGGNEGAEASVVPAPAPWRVVAVLDCDWAG